MKRFPNTDSNERRRGVTLVISAVLSTVLFGFAALTIDIGLGQIVRADLQRTADAAALAGVQRLHGDDEDAAVATATEYTLRYASLNPILNGNPAVIDPNEDIVFGQVTTAEGGAGLDFDPWATPVNAVRVTVRYELDYLFAGILGYTSRTISATAIALLPPPETVDIIPISLPAPGFGPVDPDIAEHNPGKTSPSEPADGERFQPGERVALYFFGKGQRSPVHLVLDYDGGEGVSDINRLLTAEGRLGGEVEPFTAWIGDELPVWNEGTGNDNFGGKLETRLKDDDPANDTVVVPVVEETGTSRDASGDLAGKVRIVDFAAVLLTEIRQVKVPDPNHDHKLITIEVFFGEITQTMSGSGNGLDTDIGLFTVDSVRARPMLIG